MAANPLAQVCILSIRAYQWVIAPLLPRVCRFAPSCSEYAASGAVIPGAGPATTRFRTRIAFTADAADPAPIRRGKPRLQRASRGLRGDLI
jgi:putative component of membrane protein insertase Oxa1/YidC/SpoIIIJ protein YidD